MYYYGGGSGCGCSNMSYAPCYPCFQSCGNNTSNYAIVLVLFILLVIVIGSRFSR